MAMRQVQFGPDNLPGFEIGDPSQPAIVVIQEWWGVNQVIKDIATLLSTHGFRCLVPDLYKGKVGVTAEEASHLMNNLDFQVAVRELGQAAQYLLDTGAPKVGCTGFCMGGALTFAAAQHTTTLTCAAPCYGIPDKRYFQVDQIKLPLLGLFGGKDNHKGFSDEESAKAAASSIQAAGGTIDLRVYASAPHGFLNQLVPGGKELVQSLQGCVATDEDTNAARDALVEFLSQHLLA